MVKRKAILFENVESFCHFIRTHGSAARSKTGYALYRVRRPKHPNVQRTPGASQWLVLMGFHPRRKLTGRTDHQRIEILEKDDTLETKLPGYGNCVLQVRAQSKGRALTEFITLTPWQTKRPEARRSVIFWLHKPDLLGQLVGDSMALGNDRIRYASMQYKAKKQLLVRIEQPSVYLLQLCSETFAKEIELYFSAGENLFLPWGHDYPLIDLWEKHGGATTDGGLWRFFDVDGSVKSVSPVKWQDVYDATEFTFDLDCESDWLQDDQTQHRIPLTLRSERRNRPLQPEMWMLTEEQRPHLESLLSAVDESDLDNLILSIQRNDKGQQLFFVREKHTTRNRKYFDFTGQRFATYKGYPNLFLPIDRELQPQLRRDQYPHLFELKSGELTVMMTSDESDQVTRLLRLNERSFSPLRNYIDYLIAGERELLESVMAKSVFDFGHYARAPKRPDLTQRNSEEKKKQAVVSKTDGEGKSESGSEANGTSKTRRPSRRREEDDSWKSVPRNELEKEEQEIELQLADSSPTVDQWDALLQIKAELKKHGGAAQCAVEGLWLSSSGPTVDQLRSDWAEMLSHSAKLAGADGKHPASVALRIHQAAEMAGEDATKLNNWLQQSIADLREVESQFRVKDRWLLWGELLKLNRDHVQQARVREQILRQLGVGLSYEEIPDFIRAALMRASQIDEGEGADDLADITSNLRGIEDQIRTVSSDDLSQPTLAMLARAYARVGLLDRARTLCAQLKDHDSMQMIARCLVHLFAREALASIDEPSALQHGKQYRELKTYLESDDKKLADIESTLAQRNDSDNVAEMLSAEHYRDFFPSGGRSDVDPRLETISNSFLAGEPVDVDAVFSIVDSWFEDKDLDEQRLARRTRQLVQGLLTRMKWGNDGPRVVAGFERLIDHATEEGANRSDHFYDSLLRVGFAQGLIQLGRENRAVGLMNQPILRNKIAMIDAIDVCSARLTVIESMPLRERRDLLTLLLGCLTQGVSGIYVVHVLRVLDQTIEAAVSKDKFAAQKFQHFMDHEEFMIRQRVLSEDFCKTMEPTP